MADDVGTQSLSETLVAQTDRIVGYLHALGARPAQIEDVVQEVALAAAACVEPPDSALAWLLSVSRRRFVDLLRRSQTRRQREQPLGELAGVVEATMAEGCADPSMEAEAEVAALRRCLGRLAPRARTMIDLRYWRGLSPPEIAKELDWSEPAVRVALSKARRVIEACVRRALEAKGGRDD